MRLCLRRTIDSVLAQRGDFELDYRVLDGASTDDTLEVLRSYGDRVAWVSEPDGGQVAAINKGLRSATGDVVGWLNSDDVLEPGALARIARAFSTNPRVEWVHGRCKIIDEHDREIGVSRRLAHRPCQQHEQGEQQSGEPQTVGQMQRRRPVRQHPTRLEPNQDRSAQRVRGQRQGDRDGEKGEPPAPTAHQQIGGENRGGNADQEKAQARTRLGHPVVRVRQADEVAV